MKNIQTTENQLIFEKIKEKGICMTSASSGGVCGAFANEVFEANASFGGEVSVYGDPKSLIQTSSYGGEIT